MILCDTHADPGVPGAKAQAQAEVNLQALVVLGAGGDRCGKSLEPRRRTREQDKQQSPYGAGGDDGTLIHPEAGREAYRKAGGGRGRGEGE